VSKSDFFHVAITDDLRHSVVGPDDGISTEVGKYFTGLPE